jgi:transcriptional regulator with XRE-family HTH domain
MSNSASELRRYRNQSNVTQKAVAERLGYAPSYLNKIELGHRNLHSDFADRYMSAVDELSVERRCPDYASNPHQNRHRLKTEVSDPLHEAIMKVAPGMSANQVARAILEVVLDTPPTYKSLNDEVRRHIKRDQ